MTTDRSHAIIIVDSSLRNVGTSESLTEFHYMLQKGRPISFTKASKKKQYFLRIENVRIPVGFYAYGSDNNTFLFSESTGNSAILITLPLGNYDIDELMTEIETQMNSGGSNADDYTLTYDEKSQKITISSDGDAGNFSFDASSDLLTTMGFIGSETITGNSSVVGTNVAYTNTARHLKLVVDNLVSNNVYANGLGVDKSTILQRTCN